MSIEDLYNRAARDYDQARRQLVPCFDDFYGTVIDLIPFNHNAPLKILDLGAGTGLLTSFVAEAFPKASLTLVDLSEEMLAKARERFSDQLQRFSFCTLDYGESDLEGSYDAVVSAVSIHHVADEKKRRLFRQIYAALRDRGIFINADQVLGKTPSIHKRYHETWLRQVREKGISESDLQAALERMEVDQLAPLDDQLGWLEDAGFEGVNCWYKNYSLAVYAGWK